MWGAGAGLLGGIGALLLALTTKLVMRIRFLTTSLSIRYNGISILHILQLEASLLIEPLPGIDSGISSEVPQTFKDTSTTRIIAISGFKLLSIDALR